MTVVLESGVAERCMNVCAAFARDVGMFVGLGQFARQESGPSAFPTARQIGTVYSLFTGEDMRTLLSGFVHQAEAMGMLFAAAGGLIEAQDEAVATALGAAYADPAGLQSLGTLGHAESGWLNVLSGMLDTPEGAVGGYEQVGYENVDGASLEWMISGADGLNPHDFEAISRHTADVAERLRSAGDDLHRGLSDQLGSSWQGEFATQALASLTPFTKSITDFATALDEVGTKATEVSGGFEATKRQMSDAAADYSTARAGAVTEDSAAMGLLPPSDDALADLVRRKAEAEQQARAIINREYSPSVMRGNLADLDIPTPYRVVSASSLDGVSATDLASAWNVDGVIYPAGAGTPNASAIAAMTGGAAAEVGGAGSGGTAGVAGPGATTTTTSATPTDAATEQALLASRAGGAGGAGASAASAGQAGSGGGVNASTTAAGAPFAPVGTVGAQQTGAGGGIRGIRGSGTANRNRDNERGFGNAAGLVGGGGAAAAGAAASRIGGAGTLSGIGGGVSGGAGAAGGMSGGAGAAGGAGAGAGAFGAGSAKAGAAGVGAGALSSSSSGPSSAGRAGAMPMGAMAGGANAGQNSERKGHTPAGYLTNATNTTEIIGEPLKVSPAVLGRTPVDGQAEEPAVEPAEVKKSEPFRGRVIGRSYTGRGAK